MPKTTQVKGIHLTELRTALGQAYQAMGKPEPTYTDISIAAQQTVVNAVDLNELRGAVRALVAAIAPPPRITSSLGAGMQTVNGIGTPGATVLLFVNGFARGAPAVVDAQGRWSVTDINPPLGKKDAVLVAGGFNGVDVVASAELYDPTTGTWSTAGSMSVARAAHTATRVVDGRVLVAGGGNDVDIVASAEVYDPTTGTWSATRSMSVARELHTATLLTDGRVLVAGGLCACPSAGAEIYNPTTGTWSATSSLIVNRWYHTATVLRDGTVLVAGGCWGDCDEFPASAEIYNPTTGTWSATGSLSVARDGHTAALLTDGTVLVAGGFGRASGAVRASAEIFSP